MGVLAEERTDSVWGVSPDDGGDGARVLPVCECVLRQLFYAHHIFIYTHAHTHTHTYIFMSLPTPRVFLFVSIFLRAFVGHL